MSVDGFYEVFVLLDHAGDLVGRDALISGAAALDIAAGHAIASDLAEGLEESPVELPSSVAGCLEQAARQVLRWEPSELSTEALILVTIVLQLRLELLRADVSRFHDSVRHASLLMGGPAVQIGAWAETVRRCDELLDGRDPAVQHASALVPLVAGVLCRLERRLLQSAPGLEGFEGGLRGWSSAVAGSVESMTPVMALAVCRTQRALMRRAADLVGEFEVTDGVGHERLRAAVEVSRLSWEDAYDAWRAMVPRQATASGAIDRATVAVRLAARQAGHAEKLLGFMGTGFGGNLMAAMAVTPPDVRRHSALVSAAVTLETRSDLATTVEPRQSFRSQHVEDRSRRLGPAVVFTADSSRSPLVRAPGSSSPDPERPRIEDHGALVELAGQREAGVIAAAARSGVAEAQVLVAGASPSELDALVERGRLARVAIVASGVAAAKHWSRRIPPDQVHAGDEYVAEASLRMAEIVDRWDPHRASWGSFASTAEAVVATSRRSPTASVKGRRAGPDSSQICAEGSARIWLIDSLGQPDDGKYAVKGSTSPSKAGSPPPAANSNNPGHRELGSPTSSGRRS